ncbi:Uncharacterized protein conserved in bacteria [Mycoplasmopsis maculosa]|uniref:Uncharacterized protein conserved in bacteria n=1 Tax=Mycoplasmopsis maculosa TaxID=114885 RepID=A0A449B3K6_9BACT|nr:DNA-binding protein WhiA [Mycoplasmopsis maculosa]VEU75166.1 Uncharacterized protein conserved in bacteria [Mycoplasmopsis maculosa]
MSFTKEIKNEILNKNFSSKDSYSFLRGYIYSKAIILNNFIKLQINDIYTKNTIIKLLKKNLISFLESGSTIKINRLDFDMVEDFSNPSLFFQGVFVGGGTISDLNKSSYHLQLSSNYEAYVDLMIKKLNDYDFNFSKIKHRNKFLIYIKKHEKISEFLNAIMAINSYFTFVDKQINRDYENNLNRINNIDVSNIKKFVSANIRHVNNIKKMYESKLENIFNINQLNFYNLLLEHQDESLSTLVQIYNEKYDKNITKSGVYHWLEKLNNKVSK